jgi:protein TonB
MKTSLFSGVACALVLHVGVILFGGLAFISHKKDYGTLQQVELLSEKDTAADKEKAKEKPKEEPKEQKPMATKSEDMETEREQVPDASEIVRSLELSAAAGAPALEAASLGAIEAALSGQVGGSGDFVEALTFSSGGRIGGMGKATGLEESLEQAFNLTEIDQKPNVIHQPGAVYPAAMRAKKVEGVVSILFVVDPTGKVVNPRVERSTHPAFEKPALDAVKQWKFEPAVRAGQRVPCKMRVPIRFQPR